MEDMWICPNCGAKMKKLTDTSSLYHVCRRCGCSLEGGEQNFYSGGICPNCHSTLYSNIECPYCGYDEFHKEAEQMSDEPDYMRIKCDDCGEEFDCYSEVYQVRYKSHKLGE